MRRRALLLLALVPLLAGCRFSGVPQPEPLANHAAVAALTSATGGAPLPYRVAVAPVRPLFDPLEDPSPEPTRHLALPDLDVLRRELVDALALSRAFTRVEPRGKGDATHEAVQELLWEHQDDLVLEVELLDYHQAYLGHVNYLWWLVAYGTYVWPAWMVPVDEYGAGLRARVRLRSIQEGTTPLLQAQYEVRPEDTKQEFTPSDRETVGFLDLGAVWNVETSLQESNWLAIERGVGAYARRELVVELLRDVAARVVAPMRGQGPQADALTARVRKRFALVVGVSLHDDAAVGTTPHCAEDAREVAAFLASPRGGALVPGRDLQVLVDEQATRAAILDGVAAVASRAGPGDEVVVYLAGCGGVVPGPGVDRGGAPEDGPSGWRPVFVPYDGRRADLAATSLSLQELGAALDAVRAEQVLVAVDAAFSGRGGRTLPAPADDALALGAPDLAPALGSRPGRCAVFAGGARDGAHALVESQAGLFTQVLLRGLEGAADQDGDGGVSLPELLAYVDPEVVSRAGFEGVSQTPLTLARGAVTLTWPR